ncbi:hypothetical protein ILYODFUR_004931 [Ilyodon furcidens]|uniref:Uncharacterized protein n=1 Tax=Ilyodon furcidens TaxID=33524 RepID=A0ABV0UP46_9TELE
MVVRFSLNHRSPPQQPTVLYYAPSPLHIWLKLSESKSPPPGVFLEPTPRPEVILMNAKWEGRGSSFDLCILFNLPDHQLHAGGCILTGVMALHWEYKHNESAETSFQHYGRNY